MKKKHAFSAVRDMLSQLGKKYGLSSSEVMDIFIKHKGDSAAVLAELDSYVLSGQTSVSESQTR